MHLVLKFPYFQLIKGSLGIMTFFIALSLIFDAFRATPAVRQNREPKPFLDAKRKKRCLAVSQNRN